MPIKIGRTIAHANKVRETALTIERRFAETLLKLSFVLCHPKLQEIRPFAADRTARKFTDQYA